MLEGFAKAIELPLGNVAEVGKELSEFKIRELAKKNIERINETGDAVLAKLNEIKGMTPEQLAERLDETMRQTAEFNTKSLDKAEGFKPLTAEEKARIKEDTGWSSEIIGAIRSKEEFDIYRKANLVEVEISGRKCLIRPNIDWTQKDIDGKTNLERASKGLAPLNADGKPLYLHHIGQHMDSPLAELTFEEHRCGGNDLILHRKDLNSEVHSDENLWKADRIQYWKNRAMAEGGIIS